MLPGQTEVRLNENIAPEDVDVNDVFDTCVDVSDRLCALLFERMIYGLQQRWLREDLGPRWNKNNRAGSLACPRCNHRFLIRRGWRSRRIRTSRGVFQIHLAQVSCRRCQRVFRPYALRLGLPSALRFLPEVEEKMLDLATQLSYSRAQGILSRLTRTRVSPETIRRRIFQKAEEEKEQALPDRVLHCMVDDTKVKAGSKARGARVHMAISVEEGPVLHNRPTLKKGLLSFWVGAAEKLKADLRRVSPRYLVHDGCLDLSGCSKRVQRCRWHLPYELRRFLYFDGVPWRESVSFAGELTEILWEKGRVAYNRFTRMLRDHGFERSARYLANAKKEIFTHRRYQSFKFTTISPLEREMRELNRRMDVGARWSTQGAENMGWVLFSRRFRHRNQLLKIQELLSPG